MSVFPFRMPKSLPAVHGTKVSHNIGFECILFTLCTEHCKCNSSIGYYLIMGGTGITHHNRIHKWRGCLRATFSTHYANLNIWILLKEFLDCHTFSTVHSALHILSTVKIVNKFTWNPACTTNWPATFLRFWRDNRWLTKLQVFCQYRVLNIFAFIDFSLTTLQSNNTHI